MAENENAPATKKDVAVVAKDVAAVAKDVAAVAKDVAAVRRDLAASEERLSEQMRDMQTALLKACLPWQDQVRMQFRELEVNTGNSVSTVKERMNILERRLWEIEKRLLMNPPAAQFPDPDGIRDREGALPSRECFVVESYAFPGFRAPSRINFTSAVWSRSLNRLKRTQGRPILALGSAALCRSAT